MEESQKTKSLVEKIVTWFAVASIFLASLACSQDTISLVALTQTAVTAELLGITVAPVAMGIEEDDENPAEVMEIDAPVPADIDEDWDPLETLTVELQPMIDLTANPPAEYYSLQGDTLRSVALHFNVQPSEILISEAIDENAYLPVGLAMQIPNRIESTGPGDQLLPDSEVIYSPSAVDFDVIGYVENAGGYLNTYQESTAAGNLSGAEIVDRAALKYSINPRILLSILEYQSGWVFGFPENTSLRKYPMGFLDTKYSGLEKQLNWACKQLSTGYYGWRDGSLVEIEFPNNGKLRNSPYVNAGTISIHYFFAQLRNVDAWFDVFYGDNSFLEYHSSMFGDYWSRAASVEPILDETVRQIEMDLPFPEGHSWNYTGGPHQAWGVGTAWGALDFAPMGVSGCAESTDWITSVHSGLVVRSENATVVVDSDMDGSEQTGWVIFYFHVQTKGRIPTGVIVETGDRLGHPSCEGGKATGTHVHIARKYNGEWISAGIAGAPFILSGWQAYNGPAAYQGLMIKNEEIIKSSQVSSMASSVKHTTTQD